MTVYVTQEIIGRDLSDAKTFGELEVLVPAAEQATLSAHPLVRRMWRKLVNFTDEDYLLLAGDPVAIATAAALASHYNKGRFKVLKWDRLTAKYLPLQVDVTERGK